MGQHLEHYLDKYLECFDDKFPMIPLGRGRTEAEIISIIKECLEKNKDVYELGLVKDEDNVVY